MTDEQSETHERGESPMREAERRIRELAGRQHGVVGRAQLVEAGVAAHAIDYRVGTGRLQRVHAGVYRVGPLRSRHERDFAALLSCGSGSVLSHASAAPLLTIPVARRGDGPVEVTVVGRCRVRGPDVRVHRVAALEADETTVIDGLPVTTPARTLLDLAATLDARQLERAVAHALHQDLVNVEHLAAALTRHRGRAGSARLRALLGLEGGPAFTRSEAESRFLALIRKARLRAPAVNVRIQGLEVDFAWQAEKLIVEVDGFAHHASARAFETDRARDAVLAAAGFRVMRVTWRQLANDAAALLVRLGQALGPPR